MPLRLRAKQQWKNFNFPISFKANAQDRMKDAKNVYTNQDILETRNGISRWNATAFSAAPQSISFFKDNSNIIYNVAKDATILYKANATGAHTSLKTGLTGANKHRAVSFNNRHIMSIESDGQYSYNGTTFSQLGQPISAAITAAKDEGGGTLSNSTYQVAITFYSTSLGFESNIGTASSNVTTDGGNDAIAVSDIPSTAANTFIDKVRVYLKDVTAAGEWLFIAELSLGTTTYSVAADPTSAVVPPTKNAPPITGGSKYLGVFGSRLCYAGNSNFPSDVFFSEPFLPDAWDQTSTARTINAAGAGPITGIGVGYYGDSNQTPYVAIFKRNHIELYTELGGSGQQIVISDNVGCVSHDTIEIVNGDIYFMSSQGWSIISNGKIVETKDKNNSIDGGDINDIFTRSGFTFELNKSNYANFFSVYYPTLRQYMTFISEGTNTSINKSYNFESAIGGFRTYEFKVAFTGATLSEDSTGEDIILFVGEGGYIYSHSVKETVGTDVDKDGVDVAVDALAQLYWIRGNDFDSSYNFGPFILRALASNTALTVKYFLDYSQQAPINLSYAFDDTDEGFILDVSLLDVGILGDGRTIVRYAGEILRSGQSLLIGFYKSVQGESISLIEGQLDVQKNGNIN